MIDSIEPFVSCPTTTNSHSNVYTIHVTQTIKLEYDIDSK